MASALDLCNLYKQLESRALRWLRRGISTRFSTKLLKTDGPANYFFGLRSNSCSAKSQMNRFETPFLGYFSCVLQKKIQPAGKCFESPCDYVEAIIVPRWGMISFR